MKKLIIVLACSVAFSVILFSSCAPTQKIKDKTGAQLWGENCNRCHNAPSMEQYGKDQWVVIGDHMRVRANVTDEEASKIVAFLQGSGQ
ncbi:MAG TPA: cytochrome c [Chitinophagales bacterium]|nr:cytochrome c [Chitinophagales bacterium]